MTKKMIWKFPLQTVGVQEINMPQGAQILSVQIQRKVMCLWAMVDSTAPVEPVTIHIIGTGNPAPSDVDLDFIDTVQVAGGALIWHIFKEV